MNYCTLSNYHKNYHKKIPEDDYLHKNIFVVFQVVIPIQGFAIKVQK